jgi:glycosyltransferase involved in cell wall biosynthesis
LDVDLYQTMDAIFVQSDFEADHLAKAGVSRSRLVRCGCAPSSEPTGDGNRFRRSHNLLDTKIVLFVGRKSRGKGYHALRSAIANLASRGHNLILVSIGRDAESPYPSLPPENDLDLGAVGESIKQDALAACDIFVLPSEAESFGIVYVEAWAYGKPVVCGTAPASRELVTRHRGGLVSDGSIDGIQDAIIKLLDAPDDGRLMGQAGCEAVAAEYTSEKLVRRHLQTWDRLLGKS